MLIFWSHTYSAWEFWNTPHDDFDIVPMVPRFVLPLFPNFFYKYIQVYKPIRNLRILYYLLKNGSNAIIRSNSHGSPTYVIHNRKKSNWYDEKGIGYSTALSLPVPAWWSSLEYWIHLQWNTMIYSYSYWINITTRKCDSQISLVAHVLLLILDK